MNSLFEVFQSGKHHSKESEHLKVLNVVLLTADSGDAAVLVLIDLIAAFDNIDGEILIARLEWLVRI